MSNNLPEQAYNRSSTAVATRPLDGEGLDANDITIPRMKVGQGISRVVTDDPTLYGAVYVLESRDADPASVLAKAPGKGELGEPVRFYVHGDPRKGWSWKPAVEGSDWRGQDYPDLRDVEGQDPRKVRRTYDYLITVPGYEMLPVRFLLHGSFGGQAAKAINTQLLLARQKGIESHSIAFKLQTRKTSSPSGGQERAFIQVVVGLDKVAAKDKAADMELVEGHRFLVGSAASVQTVEDDDTAQGRAASSAPSLD